MQQLAKQVGADDTMLRFAILNGLRADLKSHVTRAQPASLKVLQEAAKIAVLCPVEKPTYDDSLTVQLALMQDQLKQVLTNQNTGAAKSAAPVNDGDDRRLRRSPSPRRVQFEDGRSPSSNERRSRYEDYRYDQPQFTGRFQGRGRGALRGYRGGGTFYAQRHDEQPIIIKRSTVDSRRHVNAVLSEVEVVTECPSETSLRVANR